MRKRIASALCAVLLALGCAVPAFAAEKTTYTIEEMNITLELPDDLYVFEQSDFNILDPNPDLEKAGFTDPQEQLEMMGISTDQIRVSEHCTCCEPQLFCSYRREGGTYMRMGGGLCMKEK